MKHARMATRDELRGALRHLTYCYGLAPDEAGVQVMLALIDEMYESIDDEDAGALRSYLAEVGARAVIADANGPGETERILEGFAAWLGASAPPGADRGPDAPEAPRATPAIAPVSASAEAPVSLPVSMGGIEPGLVAEVRAALEAGSLSLRSLRVRVGRGWGPVRAALGGLVDAGEVIRDGQRGRHVRFRLIAPHGSPVAERRRTADPMDGQSPPTTLAEAQRGVPLRQAR